MIKENRLFITTQIPPGRRSGKTIGYLVHFPSSRDIHNVKCPNDIHVLDVSGYLLSTMHAIVPMGTQICQYHYIDL